MMNVDPVLKGFGFLYYPSNFVRGFTKAPVDYYFRPGHNYFILHPYEKEKRPRFCRGNFLDHESIFNVTKQWFKSYKDTCHFSITLGLHDYTHDVPAGKQVSFFPRGSRRSQLTTSSGIRDLRDFTPRCPLPIVGSHAPLGRVESDKPLRLLADSPRHTM